jgi:prevent-host-death family protein
MNVANIHEAKTHFSRLVDRAAGGEEIVIAKAGKPAAKCAVQGILETETPARLDEGKDLDQSGFRQKRRSDRDVILTASD